MRYKIAKIILLITLSASLILMQGCSTSPSKKDKGSTQKGKADRNAEAIIEAPVEDTAKPTFKLIPLNETQEFEAKEAKRDYKKAIKLLKAGNKDAAMTMFKSINARFPSLSGPLVNQAIIHINFKRYIEAEEALRQALAIYPENPYTLNMLGIVLRDQGKFKEAKVNYVKALNIDNSYAKAHLNLGILADLYLRNLPLALDHFERYQSLQKAPDKRVKGWIKDLQRRIKRSKT